MIRLTETEIKALRWLAAEFPMGSRWKLKTWAEIEQGLLSSAGCKGETECDALVKGLDGLGLFEGRRRIGNMFDGAVTAYGEQVLREDAARAEEKVRIGGPAKRLVRYLGAQAGPLVVQALVGAAIGVISGLLTGTLATTIPTALLAALVSGRVPPSKAT